MNHQPEISNSTTHVVGYIQLLSGRTVPPDWTLCDGRLLSIDDHPALFAKLGARFGGDGFNTFAVPNLNGGEHCFAICHDGLFPRTAVSPNEWRTAATDMPYIIKQVQAYRQAHRHDYGLRTPHPHVDDVDPDWLERQVQTLIDGYAQGRDPLHRHVHVDDVDPDWLERQAQVLIDAYSRTSHPHPDHVHVDDVDLDWLEKQAQVLIDAYSRTSHPHPDHVHGDDLDPDWLERQAQVLHDAIERGHDTHIHHPHVSHLDDEWIAAQADAAPVTHAEAKEAVADELQRIEGIGKKIARLLDEAGIKTFAQLAEQPVDQLKMLLQEKRLNFARPDTWPAQAALAAAGKWDALTDFQKTLKGGRRV